MNCCRARKEEISGNLVSCRAIDWTRVRRFGLVTPNTNVQLSYGYKSLSVRINRHSSDFGVNWFRMITLNKFSVLNYYRLVSRRTRVLISLFTFKY